MSRVSSLPQRVNPLSVTTGKKKKNYDRFLDLMHVNHYFMVAYLGCHDVIPLSVATGKKITIIFGPHTCESLLSVV